MTEPGESGTPRLRLGPLVRHASTDDATIWVQTDAPCTVEVRAAGRTFSEPTWSVEGHHYAIVLVEGLPADSAIPYEVALDGNVVWPEPESGFPPSVLRTNAPSDPVTIVFGSCRVAAPHEPPYTLPKERDPRGREVDALRALALRMRDQAPQEWPHALLLLGDQVYADEVHPHIEPHLDGEGGEVVSFEDYVRLYCASWGEPVIRWLLSTLPTAMIFDDHDVHDDWNTSMEWLAEMRKKPWWRKRIVSAFESYFIYQHLGNLSPAELEDSEIYRNLRTMEDPTQMLRDFARRADLEVEGTRWSFCRRIGNAKLVMIDSRAGRVLEPRNRSMVDPAEWAWIEEHARGDVEHLLIGTSLPLIMGPALYWLEAWNELVADGAWGPRAKKLAEKVRQGLDLEHWPAFQRSFRRLCDLLTEVGAGRMGRAPSTICVLSGDVHHAYLAQIGFRPGSGVTSAVWQAVCSPFRNPLDTNERRVILGAWTRAAELVTRKLARRAGAQEPPVSWRLAHKQPWFNNQVATLRFDGPHATFLLEKALPTADGHGDPELECVFERSIEPNAVFART